VVLGVFVNLFDHYHGQMVLRITRSDDSAVDPTLEGYTLHNISSNQAVPPYGAKSASFYIIQKQFQYELSRKGQCVWSYGRATSRPRGFTSVSRFSLSFFVASVSRIYSKEQIVSLSSSKREDSHVLFPEGTRASISSSRRIHEGICR
jgi:hypothetical protein